MSPEDLVKKLGCPNKQSVVQLIDDLRYAGIEVETSLSNGTVIRNRSTEGGRHGSKVNTYRIRNGPSTFEVLRDDMTAATNRRRGRSAT